MHLQCYKSIMWFYKLRDKLIIFGPDAQDYLDICNKNNKIISVLRNPNHGYQFFGSLMYINIIEKEAFWETNSHQLILLHKANIIPSGPFYILHMIPACSVTPALFPHISIYDFNIPNLCNHKSNCHDRFCNEHNKEMIGYNFPIKYSNHSLHKKYNLNERINNR